MNPDSLTPKEFEQEVQRWFRAAAGQLDSFEASHREKISGSDGEYEIDVSIRFTAFDGAKFLVLAECKKQKARVKREVVQILHDRMQSVGAHKGFVITTSSFQKGAMDYAEKHGIALLEVVDGSWAYIRASAKRDTPPKLPPGARPVVAFHVFETADGNKGLNLISEKLACHLRGLLGLDD